MSKEDKLKAMWRDLPTMDQEEIMKQLRKLHVEISYDEIVQRLATTYDDLQVADAIFETYPVDDTNSPYPKEFVDEAITKIARIESFPFTHYGILSQDILELHEVLCSDEQRCHRLQELFTKLFQLCKRFKLDNFDNLVYTINDSCDMGKEFLHYLSLLQKQDTMEAHRQVTQMVDRFFQVFAQMNPFIEEQISYHQATSYIAMKSSKGEKMFVALMKEVPDTTEVVYRYGMSYYKMDKKRTKTIFERYRKELHKDSEFYDKIQKILKEKN